MLAEMQMTLASYLPASVKQFGRRLGFSGQHPKLQGLGIVTDLQPWVCTDTLDTILPLHNYFSVLYPERDTATVGRLCIADAEGRGLVHQTIAVPPHGVTVHRLSDLLRHGPTGTLGTVSWRLEIPPSVRAVLHDQPSWYFWDRFVVGYQGTSGPPSFVHGVDKTWICPQEGDPTLWYPAHGKTRTWTLEPPLTVTARKRVSLLLVNRVNRAVLMAIWIWRGAQEAVDLIRLAPLGVCRYPLPVGESLRVMVDGLPTTWGRPILLTEDANGCVDALHT